MLASQDIDPLTVSARWLKNLRRAADNYDRLRAIQARATPELPRLFAEIYHYEKTLMAMSPIRRVSGGQFLSETSQGQLESALPSMVQQGIADWTQGFLDTVLDWQHEVKDYAAGLTKYELFRHTIAADQRKQALQLLRSNRVAAYEPGQTFMALDAAGLSPAQLGQLEAQLQMRRVLRLLFARHSSGMTRQSSQRWPNYQRAGNDPLGLYSGQPRPNLAFFARRNNLRAKIMAQPKDNTQPLRLDAELYLALMLDRLCAKNPALGAWPDTTRKFYEADKILLTGLPQADQLIAKAFAVGSLRAALQRLQDEVQSWDNDAAQASITATIAQERQILLARLNPTFCAMNILRGAHYIGGANNIDAAFCEITRWLLAPAAVEDIFRPSEMRDWKLWLSTHDAKVRRFKAERAQHMAETKLADIAQQLQGLPQRQFIPSEPELDPARLALKRQRWERKERRKLERQQARIEQREALRLAAAEVAAVTRPEKTDPVVLREQRKQMIEQRRFLAEASAAAKIAARKRKREKERNHPVSNPTDKLTVAKQEMLTPKAKPAKVKSRPTPADRAEWLAQRAAMRRARGRPKPQL